MTEASAPGLEIPGILNFRDVGGLSAGGGRTRSGVLFRSGHLGALAPDGAARIEGLGIRRIVDLRGEDEVRRAPNAVGALPVETVRLPIMSGSVASLYERDLPLAVAYREMVDEDAERVIAVVRVLAERHPVLVHCSVGKDRTGVTVALALAAAGVDEAAIVADYARSETLIPDARNRRIVEWLRGENPDAVHVEELATRSPATVMSGLLADLAARYGSPTGYLRAHGLGDVEIASLRAALVG